MSYEASTAGIGGGERRRSAFHIGYGGVVGASRRRLAQPEALARGVITTGSAQLRTLGRSIRTGAAMAAVFQEDLKMTSKKIFDPQDRLLVRLNRSFLISCILSIAIDPMFFYGPVVTLEDNNNNMCIGIERSLAISTAVLRTVVDLFFLARIVLQFRTAFIAPSSRVFGRSELVVIWRFLASNNKTAVLETKDNLLFIIIAKYVPRLVRIYPLSRELKCTSGVFAETALAGATYYLLWYMLASHVRSRPVIRSPAGKLDQSCLTEGLCQIVGTFWYLLSIEQVSDCWRANCDEFPWCNTIYMYCGSTEENNDKYKEWTTVIRQVIYENCEPDGQNPFDYGIYSSAVTSEVIRSKDMTTKLLFCLWFGLANLSTLGQGLKTTIYTGESLFAISLATFGLILMAMLIGNIQTYLQSLTMSLEEMRVKRRDSEQWMHHRLLPQELRERVRRYDQYKWVNTRGVDEEALVQNLPKDLRRDIKRHLCLGLVRRVPLFDNMDERLLDAICERLKPALYMERTYIIREGDPVD
ncbi:hypothetical protein ACQ4PT_068644 [Festuca glaucescens]